MATATGAAHNFIVDIVPPTIFLIVAIVAIAGTWQIFTKMGERGWKSVIPLYNEYVVFGNVWNTKAFWKMIAVSIAAGICSGITQILFENSLDTLTFVGSAISLILLIATLVYQVRFCNKVSKAFGKGKGMTLALIVIPFVATLILGFGPAQYKGARKQG